MIYSEKFFEIPHKSEASEKLLRNKKRVTLVKYVTDVNIALIPEKRKRYTWPHFSMTSPIKELGEFIKTRNFIMLVHYQLYSVKITF